MTQKRLAEPNKETEPLVQDEEESEKPEDTMSEDLIKRALDIRENLLDWKVESVELITSDDATASPLMVTRFDHQYEIMDFLQGEIKSKAKVKFVPSSSKESEVCSFLMWSMACCVPACAWASYKLICCRGGHKYSAQELISGYIYGDEGDRRYGND
eukprot:UN04701